MCLSCWRRLAIDQSSEPSDRSEDTPIADHQIKQVISEVQHRIPYVRLRTVLRFLLVLAALYGIGWMFWFSWAALLPFQIGVILAYLTLPVINRMEQYMPRWAAIVLVYTGGLIIFISGIAIIVPPLIAQANEAINSLPSFAEIQHQANVIFEQVEALRENTPEALRQPIEEGLNEAIVSLQSNLTAYVQSVLSLIISSTLSLINTVTFVLGFLIVPFWLFYVVKDQRLGRDTFDSMLHPMIRADFWAIIKIFDRVFSSYIRGQLLLGLVVGSAAWVGLTVLELAGFGIRYSVLLAVIAGVTELIPIVGPVIGAIPAIGMGLFDSPTTALAVVILYMLIQQLENNLLVPRIVGQSVGIHPAILMVLIVIISQVLGFIGIILAAPLAAVVRDIFRYIYGRLSDPPRPAGLLPDEPPVAAQPDTQPQPLSSEEPTPAEASH